MPDNKFMTFPKTFFLAIILMLLLTNGAASDIPYQPDWSSLDTRSIPEWWTKARFGIFIYWGLSSVPAYAPRGEYSEWYEYRVRKPGSGSAETRDFHNETYGPKFSYADFTPMFKAELFNPEEWVKVVEDSGAKYVVINAKHHDGYAMWPSSDANRTWGRPWNSLDTGPGRDVLGELKSAFSDSGIHFGVYYSLYEWFNPLYLEDPLRYSAEHHFPQFKDLVTRYEPEIIFADGEWSHNDDVWKSNELIAWLYNESPVRDSVVINDRWFKGSRHKHGDYYTTEYGSGLEGIHHPWEENRAISKSYAYNRMEKAEDYSTPRELILMLADIVSRGGNLLLDIGPSADGRIPEIMEDRLGKMGEWLKVNGEAIFETIPWKKSCQWGEGRVADATRGEFKTGYDILRLTLDPDPGDAVKELFFTCRDKIIYAISPVFPRGKLQVENLNLPSGSEVTLLGSDIKLEWKNQGGNLLVDVPHMTPDELPCRFAWVFKINPASGF